MPFLGLALHSRSPHRLPHSLTRNSQDLYSKENPNSLQLSDSSFPEETGFHLEEDSQTSSQHTSQGECLGGLECGGSGCGC